MVTESAIKAIAKSASVNITNQNIGPDPPFQVHCTTGGKEVFPQKTLAYGENIYWKFHPKFSSITVTSSEAPDSKILLCGRRPSSWCSISHGPARIVYGLRVRMCLLDLKRES